MEQNDYFIAKIGADTAENEPSKVDGLAAESEKDTVSYLSTKGRPAPLLLGRSGAVLS